jgi:hypothetical protein
MGRGNRPETYLELMRREDIAPKLHLDRTLFFIARRRSEMQP